MFKLKEIYEADRRILKCDCIRYSSAEVCTINIPNSKIYINILREISVESLLKSYLELNFEVLKRVDNNRYGDGKDLKLINLGPTAFAAILN